MSIIRGLLGWSLIQCVWQRRRQLIQHPRNDQPSGSRRVALASLAKCALRDTVSNKGKKTSKPAQEYEPTAQERAAIKRVLERQAIKAPAARFNIEMTASNVASISADHPEPAICHSLLADALATGDCEFAGGLLTQLADVTRSGKVASKQELNFILSVVHGINPRDETEALLAVQMTAIHNATIVAARRLTRTETIPQQDSASNMLNKLARTFAAQVEALKKYRSAGEQTIKVQHVTVNDGGQAIVGNVSQGGGGIAKNGGQPDGPSEENECGPALLGDEQTLAAQLPSPCGAGLEGVPISRGEGRGTKGQG